MSATYVCNRGRGEYHFGSDWIDVLYMGAQFGDEASSGNFFAPTWENFYAVD